MKRLAVLAIAAVSLVPTPAFADRGHDDYEQPRCDEEECHDDHEEGCDGIFNFCNITVPEFIGRGGENPEAEERMDEAKGSEDSPSREAGSSQSS